MKNFRSNISFRIQMTDLNQNLPSFKQRVWLREAGRRSKKSASLQQFGQAASLFLVQELALASVQKQNKLKILIIFCPLAVCPV